MTTVEETGTVDAPVGAPTAPWEPPSRTVHCSSTVAATAAAAIAPSAATAHHAAAVRAARLATAMNLRTALRAPSSRFRGFVAHFPT